MERKRIYSFATVKVYECGNTLEITTATGAREPTILRLPDNKYMNLKTGEIKECNTNATLRIDNKSNIKRTMKKLRRLINNNFNNKTHGLFITLTYKVCMRDSKKVYQDFKKFMKKLRKKYKSYQLEYISVLEPQASGSWHLHLLLKSNKKIYIPNDEMANLWQQGFTKTKSLSNIKNIGNYLCAYLSNMPLSDLVPDKDSEIDKEIDKKIIKNLRLEFYPKHINIYRCSRGIKKPKEYVSTKNEALINNGFDPDTDADYFKEINVDAKGNTYTYFLEYFNKKETVNKKRYCCDRVQANKQQYPKDRDDR